MRIILTESQYRKLLNEAESFYTQSPVLPEYDFNDGSKFSVIPMNAIPVSALYPKGVPKGGYPKKLRTQEVMEFLRNNPTKQKFPFQPSKSFDQFNKEMNINSDGSLGPGYPPPKGWQAEESAYEKFKEPLGRPDRYVTGNYRKKRGPLPPQTNKYYWDNQVKRVIKNTGSYISAPGTRVPPAETVVYGAWVPKGLENVNAWRDVPAGFYPPEFPQALSWLKKDMDQFKSLYPEAKYDHVNIWYHPEFPLGVSKSQYESYKGYEKRKNQEITFARADAMSYRTGLDNYPNAPKYNPKREQLEILESELAQVRNLFGYYVEQQPKDSDEWDWLGIALTIASLLPVVGPAALVANTTINLSRALLAANKGNYVEAGLHTLFACIPGAASQLRKIGLVPEKLIENVAKGVSNAIMGASRKVLKNNAESWFNGIVGALTLESEKLVAQGVEKFSKNVVNKFIEDTTAKGLIKIGAEDLDRELKDHATGMGSQGYSSYLEKP